VREDFTGKERRVERAENYNDAADACQGAQAAGVTACGAQCRKFTVSVFQQTVLTINY